ncbi:hypothetical protein BC831DRAFT_470099 [Entophlyctis helioformis]|nr:hypothetical protein BC831DRAFT_470099 [Entophlyctis helioformis]
MGVAIGIVVLNILISTVVFLAVRHRQIRRRRLDIKADRDRRRNHRRLRQLRRKQRSDTATVPLTVACSDNRSNSSSSQDDRDSSVVDIKDGWHDADSDADGAACLHGDDCDMAGKRDGEATARHMWPWPARTSAARTPLMKPDWQKQDDIAVLVEHSAQ